MYLAQNPFSWCGVGGGGVTVDMTVGGVTVGGVTMGGVTVGSVTVGGVTECVVRVDVKEGGFEDSSAVVSGHRREVLDNAIDLRRDVLFKDGLTDICIGVLGWTATVLVVPRNERVST